LEYIFTKSVFDNLKNTFDVEFNQLGRDYTSDEVAGKIKGYAALITGWGSPSLTASVFESADCLKIIAHSAGSVKHLLQDDVVKHFVKPRSICVCNAPMAIAYNVAEATLGLLIMTSHRLLDLAMHIPEKASWKDPDVPRDVLTINGSTIGIVGASTVGREVMRLLKPFDAKILVYDPYLAESEAMTLGVEKTSLEDLFRRADFVSVHAPMTEETYHMIGERHLKLLRDGAVFVNTSRGKVIDQEALRRECETGRILAALDVTDPEPLPPDSPLRGLRNVIITPHITGTGAYGAKKIGEMTLRALVDYFGGKKVENQVNFGRYSILA